MANFNLLLIRVVVSFLNRRKKRNYYGNTNG